MKFIAPPIFAFLSLMFAGCDGSYGPQCFNGTNEDVQVRLVFVDHNTNPPFFTLHPHQGYSNMTRGMRLSSLVIVIGGRQFSYDKQQLDLFFVKLKSQNDALIVINNNGIEIKSLDEAYRNGFFTNEG